MLVRLQGSLERLGERWRDDLIDVVSRTATDAVREAIHKLVGGSLPLRTPLREPSRAPVRSPWYSPNAPEREPRSQYWGDETAGDGDGWGGEGWDELDRPRPPSLEPVPPQTTSASTPPTFLGSPVWSSRVACFTAVGLGVAAAVGGWLLGGGVALGVSHQLLMLLRLLQT
jgi:hypothetical protein